MTRSTLARRYAPLVALAVLQLLIIGFVPSKAAKSGSQVSAGAGTGRTATAAAGTSGATGAGAGTASGGPAAAGGPAAGGPGGSVAGAPPGADVGGDTSHCVGDREFDPGISYWAPPCTPGTVGATGIDNKTVAVVVRNC